MAHQQQAHAPAVPSSRSSPLLTRPSNPPLISDAVVFSHTKFPSRQSSFVAGTMSSATFQLSETTLPRLESPPQVKKFRVEAPRGEGVRRMKVCIVKHGEKLGFGARHDRYKRLQVSTLQGSDSKLQIGDTLLSVNGADLTGLEFESVIELLKATQPGELVFEIERMETSSQQLNGFAVSHVDPRIRSTFGPVGNVWTAANDAATAATGGLKQTFWPQNGTEQPTVPSGRLLGGYPPAAMTPSPKIPPSSISVTSASSAQQPRKRVRPAQRAVTMLDDNGQPVNVSMLLSELAKEQAQKAALEEKNTGLRKRLQQMLIEHDIVRVQASDRLKDAQEKAHRELSEVRDQLVAVQAQVRLQDRAPDVGRADSITNELAACKAQIERLKRAEADRTELLATRYRTECRIAAVDAQRVMKSVIEMFQTKLRQVGRMGRNNSDKDNKLEVSCDGVRRLVFMKICKMTHDFAFYASADFHSQDIVRHTLEQQELEDVFGTSLAHEERTGLLYVAIAPMHVVFDPNTDNVVLKCQWAEKHVLRDLARNFRS